MLHVVTLNTIRNQVSLMNPNFSNIAICFSKMVNSFRMVYNIFLAIQLSDTRSVVCFQAEPRLWLQRGGAVLADRRAPQSLWRRPDRSDGPRTRGSLEHERPTKDKEMDIFYEMD